VYKIVRSGQLPEIISRKPQAVLMLLHRHARNDLLAFLNSRKEMMVSNINFLTRKGNCQRLSPLVAFVLFVENQVTL